MRKPTPEARTALRRMKPYSPGKPIWEVADEYGLDRVYKLASNENPLGPSPKAAEAIAGAIGELHRYPDAGGIRLREALAARYGLSLEQVLVTNGGDELITLLSETYLSPGDAIVVPDPSFTEYEFGGQLMDANVIKVPLGPGFTYDLDAMLAAASDPANRVKLVYLCSPNNPTGTYIPTPALDRFVAALPAGVLLVLDAAYAHYAEAPDYTFGLDHVRAGAPIVVLQTFSKIYGLAGIRVGFGLMAREVALQILQVKEPFNVNALAQTAAIAALSDADHVIRSQKLNAEGRQSLYAAFDRLGLGYTPSMSNFILVELGDRAKAVYEGLMRMGVIVRYAGIWELPGHLRITVGGAEENAAFVDALEKVLQQ